MQPFFLERWFLVMVVVVAGEKEVIERREMFLSHLSQGCWLQGDAGEGGN